VERSAYGLPSFAERQAEVRVGQTLSTRVAEGRVFIDTTDYGYLAVEVALGHPGHSLSHNAKDPRRSSPDVFRDNQTFQDFVTHERLTWIVTTESRAAFLRDHGVTLQREGRLIWGALP
jgi:hypothetical protein